ncbi:MAG: signal peptidase I [Actinomycetota bacterium]|nr:signal peptidase I [Actinomycetota bacterium]
MSDDTESADRLQFESADSAQNGDLADSFAIDSAVNEDDEVAPGLSTAASPGRSGGRHSKQRTPDPSVPEPSYASQVNHDTASLDPPNDETVVLPRIASGPEGAPAGAAGVPVPGPEPRTGRLRRRKRMRRKAPWWELPVLVAIAILVAVLVKTFVIQPFFIPSPSMEQTLHGCQGCQGDRILVNKPIYDLRDPHAGDIVVFHAPPGWEDEPASKPPSNPVVKALRGFGQLVGFVPPDGLVLVKRVIAVGGETIKGVSLNGRDRIMISTHGASGPWRTLDEPYTYYRGEDSRATFGPVTVPQGRLWVMGDHRDDSADSRFHCGADAAQGPDDANCDPKASTVAIDEVIGKAVVIAWPPSRWRTLGTPATFKNAALAVAGENPLVGGTVLVLPLYLLRRRRRRLP